MHSVLQFSWYILCHTKWYKRGLYNTWSATQYLCFRSGDEDWWLHGQVQISEVPFPNHILHRNPASRIKLLSSFEFLLIPHLSLLCSDCNSNTHHSNTSTHNQHRLNHYHSHHPHYTAAINSTAVTITSPTTPATILLITVPPYYQGSH